VILWSGVKKQVGERGNGADKGVKKRQVIARFRGEMSGSLSKSNYTERE